MSFLAAVTECSFTWFCHLSQLLHPALPMGMVFGWLLSDRQSLVELSPLPFCILCIGPRTPVVATEKLTAAAPPLAVASAPKFSFIKLVRLTVLIAHPLSLFQCHCLSILFFPPTALSPIHRPSAAKLLLLLSQQFKELTGVCFLSLLRRTRGLTASTVRTCFGIVSEPEHCFILILHTPLVAKLLLDCPTIPQLKCWRCRVCWPARYYTKVFQNNCNEVAFTTGRVYRLST